MPRAVISNSLLDHLWNPLRNFLTKVIFLTLLSFTALITSAQDSVYSSEKKSRILSLSALTLASTGSYMYLNSIWYKDVEKQDFQFFNDLDQWGGMDKLGHICTTYQLSSAANSYFKRFRWSNNSALLGSLYGFSYTSALEIFDGYSQGWGFSVPDVSANFLGSSLFLIQEKVFQEQKLLVKWSYHDSHFSKYNPELLGSSKKERIFKDYNGQTYWFSFGVWAPKKKEDRWVCLSFGYGIEGFTRSRVNEVPVQFSPKSEYFLSLDIDFSKLPVRNKHLKNFLKYVNFIKIPFPAVSWSNSSGIEFRPLYF